MDNAFVQKFSLRAMGVAGASIFLTFFAFTYAIPGWVESVAAGYIETEAKKRIGATIDAVPPATSDSALGRLAESMLEQNQSRIEELRADLRNRVFERWAAALADVRDLDCECRKRWEDWYESRLHKDIALLQVANEQIVTFIQSTYMEVATELKRDIRVFAASNAAVFVLLLLVSLLKPRAMTHLFLPGVLLAVSTLVCAYFYIFEQNWLLTIIHGSYLGFAYLAWLGLVFGLLSDIVLNRGRISTEILNGVFSAVGAAFSVVPC